LFNNEENIIYNIIKVEEILGCENIFLVLDDGTVGTFYKGEEPLEIF
jgi:hypothetical protein